MHTHTHTHTHTCSSVKLCHQLVREEGLGQFSEVLLEQAGHHVGVVRRKVHRLTWGGGGGGQCQHHQMPLIYMYIHFVIMFNGSSTYLLRLSIRSHIYMECP